MSVRAGTGVWGSVAAAAAATATLAAAAADAAAISQFAN